MPKKLFPPKFGIPIILGVIWPLGLGLEKAAIGQNLPSNLATPAATNGRAKSASGNLRPFSFTIKDDLYSLNGEHLPRVSKHSTCFETADHAYRVRITFLKTVLLSRGEPVDRGDKDLVRKWSQTIPRVARVLDQQDAIGSLKLMIYELVRPQHHQNIEIQEQLTLLWSADPGEAGNIGRTGFGPLMRLTEAVADVQYRTTNDVPDRLFRKCFLQVVYLHENGRLMPLGSLVIVSTPSGEYEFYLVPRSLLDQIVIAEK